MVNPEIALTHIAGIKLLFVALIGWVYSRCGRGWKWGSWKVKRRVIIPLILCLGWATTALLKGNYSIWLWLAIPTSWVIYYAIMSIGYGEGSPIKIKWFRRAIVGFFVGGSCILVALVTGQWLIYGLSILTATISSIALGTWNPTNASYEESLIAVSEFLFAMFLV